MIVSSITGQTSKLLKQSSTTKITAAISYETRTDTATLDSTNTPQGGITYKPVVTTGAKDSVGNVLA
jgi:hypothetical protein